MLVCFSSSAQSLRILPSKAKAGGAGTLALRLELPRDAAPVALQWTFRFPAGVIVALPDIAAANSATAAQKSLTCSNQKGSAPDAPQYACVLAGGEHPIPAGPVVTVHYRIAAGAPAGSRKVRVEKQVAVNADSHHQELPDSEGVIVVE
jgi:hypothetical protein